MTNHSEAMGFLAELTGLLRTLLQGLKDTYRPERHYMRGPGPRWRAKQAALGAAHT